MEKQTSQFVKSLARGARSKMAKAKRTYTCRTLKELIKAYRACTTSAEERALVKKESAHIRDLFKEGDTAFRRQNIAKLLFFHMNGYPTNFGMTECVKLCATEKFSDKRVAYLGLMILVDETEDILMLITNSLKRDLSNPDQHIAGLALTVLADLASADMARDLLPEIEKHLDSANAYVRKKAALASVRAVRKLSEEETPNVLVAVPRLFETRQSATHLSGTALVIALARQSPANLHQLRSSAVPAMLSVLRDLLLSTSRSSAASANVVTGVRNPFLQVKILQALRTVAGGAPREALDSVSDVLAQVTSNTDSSKFVGTAVLYECVRTIVSLNAEPSLRTLAVSTLGRFLAHKDPNVRYIALQELVKVVSPGRSDANVEQHRATITECLREADPSIRHRALEVLSAIVNASNAAEIADELALFLTTTDDDDLRESACRKLCSIADLFAPSAEWRCDTFMRALKEVDTVMPEPLVAAFVAWVSAEPSAHAHAARVAYVTGLHDSSPPAGAPSTALVTALDPFESVAPAAPAVAALAAPTPAAGPGAKSGGKRRPRFERVSVFLFGEYGDTIVNGFGEAAGGVSPDDAISAIERLLKASDVGTSAFSSSSLPCDPREDAFAQEISLVRESAMTALAKLAARLTYLASDEARRGGPGMTLGASIAGVAAGNAAPLAVEAPQGLLALMNGTADNSRAPSSALAVVSATPAAGPAAHAQGGSGSLMVTDLLASLGIGDSPPSAFVSRPHGSGDGSACLTGPVSSAGDDAAGSLMLGENEAGAHPILARARRLLAAHRQSMDTETQQRACEYARLLEGDMASLRAVAFSRMPPMDYAAIRERLKSSSAAYAADADPTGAQTPFSEDLLALLEGDDVGPAAPARPAIAGPPGSLGRPSAQPETAGFGHATLDDLLGGGGAPSAPGRATARALPTPSAGTSARSAAPAAAPAASPPSRRPQPAVPAASSAVGPVGTATLFCDDALDVSVVFFKPRPANPGHTRAEFEFKNKGAEPCSKFVFQLAVPKYMRTDMRPASSSSIPPAGSVTQDVVLENSMHGAEAVQLRYRIQYERGGEEVRAQGTVAAADLPPGL